MFNFELGLLANSWKKRSKFIDDYDKFVANCSLIDVL